LPPFDISRRAVKAAGREVRQRLAVLADLPLGTPERSPVATEAIRDLADAGVGLFEALFSPQPDDGASRIAADASRKWFNEHVAWAPSGEWVVQVVQPLRASEVVPWGLAYTPAPNQDLRSLGATFAECQGFWCVGLRCAHTGATGISKERPRKIGDRDFEVAVILEHEDDRITRYVEEGVVSSPNVVGTRLRNQVFRRKHDIPDFDEIDAFWYISLSTSAGGKYSLDDEPLGPEDLFGRESELRLFMLDGDTIADEGRDGRWLEYCLSRSHSGCIAVEVDVRSAQTRYLGWKIFAYLLHTPSKLANTMYEAREKFWPQSLMYGVYCNLDEVYIDPPPEGAVRHVDEFIEFQRRFSLSTE
jgi:hypothetical protein